MNKKIYDAMVKYMNDNNMRRCYDDYKGWSAMIGIDVSAQRLGRMYKEGMVMRHKDNGVYCYQPIR